MYFCQPCILKTNITKKILSLCAYIKIQNELNSLPFRHNAILHGVCILVLKLRSQGNSLLSRAVTSFPEVETFLSIKHSLAEYIQITCFGSTKRLLSTCIWSFLNRVYTNHYCILFSCYKNRTILLIQEANQHIKERLWGP